MSKNPKKTRQIRNTSQSAKILDYMKNGNKITSKDAYELFGCMTLAQRVADLKEAGHEIKSKQLHVNKQTTISQYYMDV